MYCCFENFVFLIFAPLCFLKAKLCCNGIVLNHSFFYLIMRKYSQGKNITVLAEQKEFKNT